jgi:hypothetical protein
MEERLMAAIGGVTTELHTVSKQVEKQGTELKAVGKDAAAGKVNFVSLLGAEGVQARVRFLAAQAKGHLAGFGPRSRVLCDAVDFVLDRRY